MTYAHDVHDGPGDPDPSGAIDAHPFPGRSIIAASWIGNIVYAGTALPAAPAESVDLSGWNNLLWYFPIPPHGSTPCGGISSSPVVIGNTVYFTCNDGYLYALPTETGESLGGPIDPKLLIWQGKVNGSAGSGPPARSARPPRAPSRPVPA